MTPLDKEAPEGRVNPKGISYLYLANNKKTALSEVRPSLDSYISLGVFKLVEEIKLVNCTEDSKSAWYTEEPSDEEKEERVWSDLNRAFSKPVQRSDKRADYIPTQIIAELFKNEGYDGIGYKSSYGEGMNIVLFDTNLVEMKKCYLFKLEDIKFEFKKKGNYFCSNKNKDND